MKNTKRVLIALLALVVLVSGLLVSSYADDEVAEEGSQVPDYADILKFYDPLYSTLYDEEDFEDGEFGGSILVMDAARPYTKAEVYGSEDKYLAIKLGHILNPDARTNAAYSVSFGGAALSKVVFRADISATHDDVKGKQCPGCSYSTDSLAASLCPLCRSELATVSAEAPTIVVAVAENEGVGAPLINFDFKNGRVSYTDGAAISYIEGLEISEGSWYSVEVVCEATQYKFQVKDGDEVYAFTAVNAPAFSFKSISVGARYVDDARGATVMIDDVFVQAGIDDRHTGVDLYAKTNEGLALMDSLLRDSAMSSEVKTGVIAVYDTLVSTYSDKLALDETGVANLASIRAAVLDFFSEQLKAATDSIDESASYSVRLALVEDNAMYAERTRELLALTENEASAALLETYDAEVAELARLAEESEQFIAYINAQMADDASVFSSEDYEVLKAFVEATEAIFTSDDGEVAYSTTYPPIKEALSSYSSTAARYALYLERSEAFCSNVAMAKLGEEDLLRPEAERQLSDDEFVKCLVAYEAASKSTFRNDTFPGMADALVDFESLVNISEISVIAERFIGNVNTAEQAIYIFKKEEWLDAAEADLGIVDVRYAGVADAKALYEALRVQIAEAKASADAYIAAVAAIEGKTGNALIEAIEAALLLKDAGNVQGYPGVTEANIALDNAHRANELKNAYAEKFITLVANIKDAKTLEERFEAITLANEASGYALDEVQGVSAAKQELVSAISSYDADIAAINASYKSVASNAGELASAATILSGIIKLVASAIKAIAG